MLWNWQENDQSEASVKIASYTLDMCQQLGLTPAHFLTSLYDHASAPSPLYDLSLGPLHLLGVEVCVHPHFVHVRFPAARPPLPMAGLVGQRQGHRLRRHRRLRYHLRRLRINGYERFVVRNISGSKVFAECIARAWSKIDLGQPGQKGI
jgi:hypothetical protein